MSEVTIIKCDGVGCENQVGLGHVDSKSVSSLDVATAAGWIRDEFDSDFCLACQDRAKSLEDNKATGDDLAAFGERISEEADKAEAKAQELGLEKNPKSQGVAVVGNPMSQEAFDEALEDVVKSLKRDLKKQKKSKEFIAETIRLLRGQALSLRETV